MKRAICAIVFVAISGIALTGCNTTAVSTHGDAGVSNPSAVPNLGVDSHGEIIGVSWPSIPASNQASIKGDSARPFLERAREDFRGDNFGNAERNFRKAVELKPDSYEAWAGLAASYDQIGRFDLADRAYDQLLKLKKNDARIMNNRGYSYLLRGDYAKAQTWFDKAQAKDPGIEEVEGNLHLLAQVRDS